jgi:signal transduction histidine kinase
VFVLAAFQNHPGPGLGGRGLIVSVAVAGYLVAILVAALTFGGAGPTVAEPPRVLPQVAIALVVLASSVVLLCLQPAGPGAEGALVGVLFFARLVPRPIALTLASVSFVALEVFVGFSGQGLAGLVILGALAGCYGLMFMAVRLREANDQAEALLLELEQSRAAEARAAGLAERQRLAREMHDVLAHSLSGLLLQLEGARMLAAQDPSDPRLPEAIDRAHHLGKSGLQEARRAIGMLRDEELPGPDRLAGLVEQFEEDRGVPCQLIVSGEPHDLASEARVALYRVAQEALTNVTKHGCPERVELRLDYEPGLTRLSVEDFSEAEDSGCPCIGGAAGAGYGLTGMRERAELLGGTLTTEPTPHGYRVELDVPA